MVYKGKKIEKEGFSLEVTKIEKVTSDVNSINYVVRQGTRELTDGFIYVMEGDNVDNKLKETLEAIIRAVKRVAPT